MSAREAAEWFRHPSQQIHSLDPDNLPVDGIEYFAQGGICLAFHAGPLPGVFFCHCGAKPDMWGRLDDDARAILGAFAERNNAEAIVAWTEGAANAARKLARRIGFSEPIEIGANSYHQVWRPL